MFMDVSSEMIHSLLPVFLVSVLGASATALGLLEGLAEGTVNVVKMFLRTALTVLRVFSSPRCS